MKYLLSQIAAIVGGSLYGADAEVRSVVTDSRSLSCEFGSAPMFVAMRGANHDSHDFVREMQSRGVKSFLVERRLEELEEGTCGAAASGGLPPRAVPRDGGGHHRLERQNGHQGVDCRGAARRREVLPLAQELQLAAGRAPLGTDARGRRGAGDFRGGYLASRRNGASGAHHPPRRGGLHLDWRRPPGELPEPRAEVRREDGAGP